MNDFFDKIIAVLDELQIAYMLSDSIALGLYVVPGATRDFDFVIHLKMDDVKSFAGKFTEGYYCDRETIEDTVKKGGIFNIIDHASGFKADFVTLKNNAFRQQEFKRRQRIDYFGKSVFVVTVEDLLISKLIWIQDYQSAIQMEDIRQVVELEQLDWEYIRHWVHELNLNTFNLLQ